MNYLKVLLPAIVLLSSCSTAPVAPPFSEFAEQYPQNPIPERVIFNFHEACNDQGQCIVSEEIIDVAVEVITDMNDTIEDLSAEVNLKLTSILHCEYASAKKTESLYYEQQLREKEGWMNVAKQSLIAGAGFLACR